MPLQNTGKRSKNQDEDEESSVNLSQDEFDYLDKERECKSYGTEDMDDLSR